MLYVETVSPQRRVVRFLLSRQFHKAPDRPPDFANLLTQFASQPRRPLNLSTLLSFGRPLTPQSLIRSASYTLSEIPRRLATRVRSLEGLPFIVGTNPYVASTLRAYRESFECLATYPPVKTLDENAQFSAQLDFLVQAHANDIPTMAKGFQECSRYMSPTQISNFLDGAIRNRISVRLIAEQHIALSQGIKENQRKNSHLGVVNLACSPFAMIKLCATFVSELCNATLGASPSVVIDGHTEATFAYVPVHLEYILTEILKNSFRATVERYYKLQVSDHQLPSIVVTISPPLARNGIGAKFMTMRVRDQGGGVAPNNLARIFSYAFTTARRDRVGDDEDVVSGIGRIDGNFLDEITRNGLRTGVGTIAGLGYGLPMSKLYANYFGGSLDLISLDGWGSDLFLKLRCLDEAGEAVK